MNKDEFDRLFDAAFEDAAKNHLPAPDPEPSWAKVEAMLKKRSKKRLWPVPYAVAASFLVGAFIIGSPSATKAFSPFIQTIKQIQSGVVSFIFGNDSEHNGPARTSPPPETVVANEGASVDAGILSEQLFKSWEEAAPYLAFPAPVIRYIPDPFKLNEVVVFSNGEGKAKKTLLLYTNESEAKSFMLTIRMLEQNETITSGTDINAAE